MAMGRKQQSVHKAFLDLHPEFEPQKVYESMCRLMKLGEEAIERGLGKLFKEGKLKTKEKRPKTSKRKRSAETALEREFR